MTTGQFVDISSFNGAVDWKAYKAWSAALDGVSRVCIRSSYGVGYYDNKYALYRAGAMAAGIDVIIYYHYCYPQFNSPVAEADWQAGVVSSIRANDMLMLDFEEDNNFSRPEWALAWLDRQSANYRGKLPLIYSYKDMIDRRLQDTRLAQYDLVYARWTYDKTIRPAAPAPWSFYKYIQYSDKAVIPGIAGIVDADMYVGIDSPVTTQVASANMIKSVTDEWNRTTVRPIPTLDTNIGQDWAKNAYTGSRAGPPITEEYDTVDFNGSPIVCQQFASARAECKDHKVRWFDARGEI